MVKKIPKTYIYLGVAILAIVVIAFAMLSGGRTGKFTGEAGHCTSCEAGYGLDNGNCVAVTTGCTDADGGYNAGMFGSCTDPSGTYGESCTAEGFLNEYRCTSQDGSCVSSTVSCEPGEVCSGGKCVANLNCGDTDGGVNLPGFGTCTDSSGSTSDRCSSGARVEEQFCSPLTGKCASWGSDCLSGTVCQSGACVTSSCTDTDGGNDYFTKGVCTDAYVTTYGGVPYPKTDKCYGNLIVEVNCIYNANNGTTACMESWQAFGYSMGTFDCTSIGKVCQNGACV